MPILLTRHLSLGATINPFVILRLNYVIKKASAARNLHLLVYPN